MKRIVSLVLVLAVCFAFSARAFAVGNETQFVSFPSPETNEPESKPEKESADSQTQEKGTSDAAEDIEASKAGKEIEMPAIDAETGNVTNQPTQVSPAANEIVSEIRSIVGDSVEIINIDGLEVPLADGSMFYIPFVDIAADAYYTAAVAWAYANDITAGVTELSFGPNQTCTRSQMVTFLWRAVGCPEPTGTASAFSDVAAGSWYEKAVAWAVENKITDGVGDGKFDPNGIVNRAQAVTFLYRAKGAPATTASESFTDVGSGEFYTDAVAWAVANEITNGMGDGSFAPANNCVRGQTVTFLYRAYK